MVQLFEGIEENKGKKYIVIPISECDSADRAIALANRYFKVKKEDLEYAKGFVAKNVLKVDKWINPKNYNVWVVARK